jgi:ABC-2 type transport system permease protein
VRKILESAFVIARRDFVATVYRPTFILFLLAPVLLFALSMGAGVLAERSGRDAMRETVALVADSETTSAVEAARATLVAGTSERTFPLLRRVNPAQNIAAQAQGLLADTEASHSAVLAGTLERPVLYAPEGDGIGRRVQLILDEARRAAALRDAGAPFQPVGLTRVAVDQSAGDLRLLRRGIAQGGQFIIFFVALMLATLLLSSLVEEKSNKIIEILAASVPLDAVFLGKLLAMLAMSVVGLLFWGVLLAIGYFFFQVAADWMAVPQAAPAVGWPIFFVLLILYYAANYMLLGATFLGIGGQATSVRDVQTLSMPATFLQMIVFFGAMTVVNEPFSTLSWAVYIFPLSSPLGMIAMAATSEALWPHLLALVWQAVWVVIIIRIAARLFRRTVMKSANSGPMFGFGRRRPPAEQPAE